MSDFRLSAAAEDDIVDILRWSHEMFGERARLAYEALLTTALHDAARHRDQPDIAIRRPELGDDVYVWHLRRSRDQPPGRPVKRPRHFVVHKIERDAVLIGRVLHDSMELSRHLDDRAWE
ncbi:MAG: type II toxin-antitoxin system RelE/ParE family toxin [Aeromicrobium sp.]|uniref:type II toxin-antitoxin system RelE/ParE family toxin n=1 Tax=Aeromicrobium sp. TaxID=1871063 RepID=UPI0039E3DA2D